MQETYKILVVDDDMRLRALLERYLSKQGFQVRSVANAEQMDRMLSLKALDLTNDLCTCVSIYPA